MTAGIALFHSCRPGSTVVDIIVKATYIQDVEITAAETGIFNQMAEQYSMIFDSKNVQTFLPKHHVLC